jgi:hypothetical protein
MYYYFNHANAIFNNIKINYHKIHHQIWQEIPCYEYLGAHPTFFLFSHYRAGFQKYLSVD